MSGRLITARAIARRCFSPPDSACGIACMLSRQARPTLGGRRHRRDNSPACGRRCAARARRCRTPRDAPAAGIPGTPPRSAGASAAVVGALQRGRPGPARRSGSGRARPVRHMDRISFSRVDLPDPEGPARKWNEPCGVARRKCPSAPRLRGRSALRRPRNGPLTAGGLGSKGSSGRSMGFLDMRVEIGNLDVGFRSGVRSGCHDTDLSWRVRRPGYFVQDDQIQASGRAVRCAACGHRWTAHPEGPLELEGGAVAKEPGDETSFEAAALTGDDLPRAFRTRAEEEKRNRQAAVTGAVWAGVARSRWPPLAGCRHRVPRNVVRAWPQMASAYATVGLAVNPTGLVIENVQREPSLEEGHPTLVVSGTIRNIEGRGACCSFAAADQVCSQRPGQACGGPDHQFRRSAHLRPGPRAASAPRSPIRRSRR